MEVSSLIFSPWGLTIGAAGIFILFKIFKGKGAAHPNKSQGDSPAPASASPKLFNSIRDRMIEQISKEPQTGSNLSILARLYSSALDGFVYALERQMSFLVGRKISEELSFCLRFESLVYLGFYSDYYGFSAQQSDEGRLILSDDIGDNWLMKAFLDEDPTLREIADERMAMYVSRIKSGKPGTSDPWATFLNLITLAAQEETIDRTGKLAIAGIFTHAVDWQSVGTNPGFVLFLAALSSLWKKTDDISTMETGELKRTILASLKSATPLQ